MENCEKKVVKNIIPDRLTLPICRDIVKYSGIFVACLCSSYPVTPIAGEYMQKTIFSVTICLWFLVFHSTFSVAAEKVIWLNSGAQSRFWPIVEQIMVAAASDLDIELTVFDFKNDPVYMLTSLREILADPENRPDCILTHNYKKKGEDVLKLVTEFNVPIFIFNAGFSEQKHVGLPREKYPLWIGQMLPDDEDGGYTLAKALIEKGKELRADQDSLVEMVAIEGNRSSDASIRRVAGLERALKEHPEVVNNQFFHAKWKKNRAMDAYRTAIKRYPNTTVFWTASEDMAIGVIEAAKEQGATPGKDFITGGFDLLPVNREYLQFGDMAFSSGGHYFDGAWALILIQDYLNGIDFAEESDGTYTFYTKMITLKKKDFEAYNDIFAVLSGSQLNKLDFRSLSKYHNKQRSHYDFSITSLLETIEQ